MTSLPSFISPRPASLRSRNGPAKAVRSALALLVLVGAASVAAQPHPQDDIDRNLQQRAAREREFNVKLQDDRTLPPPISVQPSGGFPIYVPTPGVEVLRREPPPAAGSSPRQVAPAPSVVNPRVQLEESQQRRQVELQTQTQQLPEPQRQPALESQKLQFQRETQAQDLGSKILRDSQRAMQR